MAVRWKIPFKTLRSNELLTVNIYDSTFSGEAMVLMGAAEPFETQEEGGDDLFTPVRLQSGYLRIVDDGFAADGVTAFNWRDFIRRTPEEYQIWIDGVSKECEILELRILEELVKQGKPVFVDTNISLETLRKIAQPNHVLVMLADPKISVSRFFDRPDREKQFLYRLIMEEPDPEAAMENYRQGLMRINSQEKYDHFLHSGFQVILRDDNRSVAQTLDLVEKVFGL